jgi:hypothetical protein
MAIQLNWMLAQSSIADTACSSLWRVCHSLSMRLHPCSSGSSGSNTSRQIKSHIRCSSPGYRHKECHAPHSLFLSIIPRALQSPSQHKSNPPSSVPASQTRTQQPRRYAIEMQNTEQHIQTNKCAIRGVLLLPCPFKPLLRDDEE